MKVSEIRYERLTIEEIERRAAGITERVRNAKNVSEVIAAREDYIQLVKEFLTAQQLSYMRYTINTADGFYLKEKEYYDEVAPRVQDLQRQYASAMLQSPLRPGLEKALKSLLFTAYEMQEKAVSPLIVPDMAEENRIITEYSQLMAGMTFSYKGGEIPLSMLRRYMQDDDRANRRTAYEALGRRLSEESKRLDGIFDRLVHVRDRMAKKMGYKDFVELGYYRMNRISYDESMVAGFRGNVLKYLVPAVARLKSENARLMGIEKFMLYDNDVNVPGGNPKPAEGIQGIFSAAKDMYRDMGGTTGAFFDMMVANDAFDVESRKNKWGGGYCISFPVYRQPFILANFNGTADDVGVITHEAGHALADYLTMDNRFAFDLPYGMETAEVHSMSMEFLTWKYMDAFFGSGADKHRFSHLFDALTFIPYGTIVDFFQHIVYANPGLTPAQRKAEWNKLEAQFRPYLSTEGIPYLSEGTRWQYQMHIYETPFYYIDYCLAQTAALQFLLESRKDYGGALEKYMRLVSRGGEMRFTELLSEAGLKSPFEEETIKALARETESLVRELRSRI
jgi:M3 family oligoendopeptidase